MDEQGILKSIADGEDITPDEFNASLEPKTFDMIEPDVPAVAALDMEPMDIESKR